MGNPIYTYLTLEQKGAIIQNGIDTKVLIVKEYLDSYEKIKIFNSYKIEPALWVSVTPDDTGIDVLEIEIASNIWTNYPKYKVFGRLTNYGEMYIRNSQN